MAANEFGSLLRLFRTSRGLTQLQLAELASVARDTVASYEAGRRLPDAPGVERLQSGLKLQNGDYDALRRAAGLRGVPTKFEAALKKARGAPESVWDEVQGSEWVSMVLNERREI